MFSISDGFSQLAKASGRIEKGQKEFCQIGVIHRSDIMGEKHTGDAPPGPTGGEADSISALLFGGCVVPGAGFPNAVLMEGNGRSLRGVQKAILPPPRLTTSYKSSGASRGRDRPAKAISQVGS